MELVNHRRPLRCRPVAAAPWPLRSPCPRDPAQGEPGPGHAYPPRNSQLPLTFFGFLVDKARRREYYKTKSKKPNIERSLESELMVIVTGAI
ncbi:MAG: hypothetical protein KatS3mg111_3118 [Pirellulaceae bacterium]|nr:MAG: hypothetical protein KatS3mg111_3118 [Pirellulaceae bacterium]